MKDIVTQLMRLDSTTTIKQTLHEAEEALASKNIEDPFLESSVLLKYVLKLDQVQLYLQSGEEISREQYGIFRSLIERRLNGEPAAYITGCREFFGLDFYVNSNVLIPRPETELLVEKALDIAQKNKVTTLADIGTGSGAIAVSLACKLPGIKIYATDVSVAALQVASINRAKHGVADRVNLLEGELLEPLPEPVDLIIANLPYVRKADLGKVNTHGFEPELALDGGDDGLDVIRRLCSQLTHSAGAGQARKLRPGGYLLLEIGQGQSDDVTALLHSSFPTAKIELFADLAGVGRVVAMNLSLDSKLLYC